VQAVSFAQHGDDLMILNIFKLLEIQKPSYLDLGAHHPFLISNTALLYGLGGRGVNVEANPVLLESFKKWRPQDKNINVGVGPEPGTKEFFMYNDTDGRNTFCPKEVESLKATHTVCKTLMIDVLTLDQIVEAYCDGKYPDLLSCDIEGFDYSVLQSADMSKTWPKVICVETRRHESWQMRILLASKDFNYHCRMGENLFFVHKDVADGL
jgi:FkbM family methyltransferase